MSRERGSVTIWMLGLSLILLLFGGVSLDLWRGLALQRELAAVADSAVVAAASGIDEEWYRLTGELVLDPARAETLGGAYIASQDVTLVGAVVTTAGDGSSVEVVVTGELDPGLIGVFVAESEPILVRARARATPVRVP